jgi:hypothetical protein
MVAGLMESANSQAAPIAPSAIAPANSFILETLIFCSLNCYGYSNAILDIARTSRAFNLATPDT